MSFSEAVFRKPSNKVIIIVASAAGGCALLAWIFRRRQINLAVQNSASKLLEGKTMVSSVSDALYRLEILLRELEAHRYDGEIERDKYDFMASVVNRIRGVLADLEKFEKNEFGLPMTDEIARTIWNSNDLSAKPGTLSVLSDDSFLSAIDDFSPTTCENPSLSIDFENLEFYKKGLEAVERGEVVYRKSRAEVCGCESDVDFAAKLWCLRQAFDRILNISRTKIWLIKVGRSLIADILRHFKKDPKEFYAAFDRMVEYLQNPANREQVCFELKQRRVDCLNIWDVLFDFILLDSFDDLKKPPSGTAALVKNSFLSQSMRESTLNNLIWSLIKMKRSRLQNQDGFVSRFYDISQIVSPPLIMGLLGGSNKEFEELCTDFKEGIFLLISDLFDPQQLRFNSLEELTEDVRKVLISRLEMIQIRMSDISTKLRSLHDLMVNNADLIPIIRWGFDQNAFDMVKSHKHSIVNGKLSFEQKKQMSKKQKQKIARGVGAVPQKVSDVCKLLSNVSVIPKRYNESDRTETPAIRGDETMGSELNPEIEAILRKRGAKRRNTTSISKVNAIPEKKTDNGSEKNEKVVPKKEKKVLSHKEREQLKEKRKQSRLNSKITQKAQKFTAKDEHSVIAETKENSKGNKTQETTPNISFNKLDFVIKNEQPLTKKQKNNKLSGRDYKALQTKLDKRKEFVKKLKLNDPEKAEEFENNIKWDTIINRAEGKKVKDNPQLLLKAQKRKEKIKEKRKQKWDDRLKKVDEDKQKRQDKRTTNITKRRDTKVQKKIERARKKGRLV